MENSNQIASRFRKVLLSGTWIANTHYNDQLANLSWKQATKKIGSARSLEDVLSIIKSHSGSQIKEVREW